MGAQSLTEFLLARIAEDEDRIVHDYDCDRFNQYGHTRMGDCDCKATAHLMAECEAKRRIVELHHGLAPRPPAVTALHHLAAVYADHPDYDPVWRP